MQVNPLDVERHEEETAWAVWKRRLVLAFLVAIVISFAAPSFGSCSGALGSGGSRVIGTFEIDGTKHSVTESEFDATRTRLRAFHAFLNQDLPGGDEAADAVWSHIVLDAAARAAGVHVPAAQLHEQVVQIISRYGAWSEAQYSRTVAEVARGQMTTRGFERALEEVMRVELYKRACVAPIARVDSRAAFEAWRTENPTLRVSYTVQPYATFRADVEAASPDDAVLRDFTRLPESVAVLSVPAKKVVETAYLRVLEMTDANMRAIENVLRDAGVLKSDADLKRLGLNAFVGSETAIYTRENWLRQARARYDAAKKVYEEQLAAATAAGHPERAGSPPPDPTLETPPSNKIELYDKLWREQIEREVLAQQFLKLFAARAEREGRSFEDLAQEYLVQGVRVVRNAEPLADSELAERYPDGLAAESEMAVVVREALKGPAAGAAFVPVVHTQPVPTTRFGRNLDDRGYMVLRLAGFEPTRVRTVDEARDEIVGMWREHEVRERARKSLEALRDQAAGSTSFEAAASAAGLTLRTIRALRSTTSERPEPPVDGADAAALAARDEIRYRNRVVRDYAVLSALDAGTFRADVLLDDSIEAALLERVDERVLPGPLEIRREDLHRQRLLQMRESSGAFMQLFDRAALARRFHLEIEKPVDGGAPGDGS